MKSFTRAARWYAAFLALGIVAACGDNNSNTTLPQAGATPSPSASPSLNVAVSIPQGSVGQGPAAYGTNPLVVEQGATVTWTNNDTLPHTVTADDGSFDSGTLEPGATFSHTFDQPGTYTYFCAIHGAASMSGAVQVNAGASASPTPSPTSEPSAAPSEAPGTAGGGTGTGGGGYAR